MRRILAVAVVAAACAAPPSGPAPVTRTYYVAAEETDWDYFPGGTNLISGEPWTPFDIGLAEAQPDRIGRVYRKAIYREYTDSTFTTLKPRAAEWEHLGILGPLLRGVVGDTLQVVFRNKATRPHSMHPHGVFYGKDSEGAPYADGTSGNDKADDGVPPGGTHTYIWPVPERAGPGPMEGSSVLWMYHSHTNEVFDLNAGLVGPILVTARGKAKPDGTPADVDREIVAMFGEFDENSSHFLDYNITTYAKNPKIRPRLGDFADFYYVANFRETVNGFSFGHTPGLRMKRGERVRWYVFGTTNFEMHSPHWHGQTVLANHMRTDVLALLPMEMMVADMVPDNPGTWLFHCHVGPHLLAGMQALFTVE